MCACAQRTDACEALRQDRCVGLIDCLRASLGSGSKSTVCQSFSRTRLFYRVSSNWLFHHALASFVCDGITAVAGQDVFLCFCLSQALRLGAPPAMPKASSVVSHSPSLVPASELASARTELARTRFHMAEERVVSAKLNQVRAVRRDRVLKQVSTVFNEHTEDCQCLLAWPCLSGFALRGFPFDL